MCRGFGVTMGKDTTKRTPHQQHDQKIGEYCGGKELAACSAEFGAGLARTCATCPD